jgi:hypothetical protein
MARPVRSLAQCGALCRDEATEVIVVIQGGTPQAFARCGPHGRQFRADVAALSPRAWVNTLPLPPTRRFLTVTGPTAPTEPEPTGAAATNGHGPRRRRASMPEVTIPPAEPEKVGAPA